MSNSRLPLYARLSGVVLWGLVASGLPEFLPGVVRLGVVALVFLFWPGRIASERLMKARPRDPTHALPLFLLAGLSMLAMLGWLLSLLGADYSTFEFVVYASTFILIGFDTVSHLKKSPRAINPGKPGKAPVRSLSRLVLALSVLLALYLAVSDFAMDPAGDGYDHVGFTRRILERNTLNPDMVLAPIRGAGPEPADPRKGPFHAVLAFLSSACRLDPILLWIHLPVVLAPLAFLAYYTFSLWLLPSGAYVLLSLALFIAFQGGVGVDFMDRIAYGRNLSLPFLWIILPLFVPWGAGGKGRFWILALLALGGGLVHVGFTLQVVLAVTGVLVLQRWIHLEKEGLFSNGFAIFSAGLIVLLWKLLSAQGEANLMHTHEEGVLYLMGSRFVVSPIEVLRTNGLLFLGGIVLVPFLPLLRQNRSSARLAMALSILPILIGFNPFVCPFLFDRMSYLLHRIMLVVPAFPIAALVLGSLFSGAGRMSLQMRIVAGLALALWLKAFLLPGFGAVGKRLSQERVGIGKTVTEPVFSEALSAAEKLPSGSIVISDPLTSYVLSGHRDIAPVATLHQHGNPFDPLVLERLKATRDVLSPYTGQRESLAHLERFQVGYLLINGALEGDLHRFMADWSPRFLPLLREKFSPSAGCFDVIYDSGEVVIVRVSQYKLKNESWAPTVPFLNLHEDVANGCAGTVAGEGVRVTGVRITPKELLPGENVLIEIQYEKEYGARFDLPLKLYIRFDNDDVLSKVGNYPGSKWVRRSRERTGGFLSRFRVDRTLFGGFYPPDTWPLGARVGEVFEVKLPSTLLEGDYTIRLKIIKDSLLPNFHLSDFLFNEDSYSGIACGKISVKRTIAM